MTEWLIKKFILNHGDMQDEHVRLRYGVLSSVTGVVCNILLFFVKLFIGFLMNAVSIISDAFNNLSDCMSCIVTLFGYKLADKPADREHPFGHGRIEYLISLVVAILIFLVGYELTVTSVKQVFHPKGIVFSWPLLLVLFVSVLVKLWMSHFNTVLGNRINSMAMLATAEDSKNDVMVTGMTIIAMILAKFLPNIPFDGIAGILVALLIFKSGYEIAKQIIDELLGKPADHELVKKIESIMMSHPEIIGVHDMLIHDYGPGVKIGSAHAEVDAKMDFLYAHDVIDTAEKEIQDQLHIIMTLHLDPLDLDDPKRNAYRKKIKQLLQDMDPKLDMHDFRMVKGPTHTNLVFDVLVPYECRKTEDDIRYAIDELLNKEEGKVYAVIHFDHDFTDRR